MLTPKVPFFAPAVETSSVVGAETLNLIFKPLISISNQHYALRASNFNDLLDDNLAFDNSAAISCSCRPGTDTGPVLAAEDVRLLSGGGEDRRCRQQQRSGGGGEDPSYNKHVG